MENVTPSDIAVVEQQSQRAIATLTTYSQDQINLLKNTIAKDHTDDELKLFLAFCSSKKLDPFSREVYSIKRRSGSDVKLTFQMGIDGLRSKAEETGEMDGSEVFWCGTDGAWTDIWLLDVPPSAAKVILYRKGCQKPFVGIAKWAEYKPQGNDFMWTKMPSSQLAKCAEALALRRAFPNNLGGIYSTEEMEQADRSKGEVKMPQPIAKPEVTLEKPIEFSEPPPEANREYKQSPDKTISIKQQKMLFAVWMSAGFSKEDLKKHLQSAYSIEHTDKLTRKQFDEILTLCEKEGKR